MGALRKPQSKGVVDQDGKAIAGMPEKDLRWECRTYRALIGESGAVRILVRVTTANATACRGAGRRAHHPAVPQRYPMKSLM